MFDTLAETRRRRNSGIKDRALIALFVFVMALIFSPRITQAQSTTFMYQGRLTDAGASANGSYDLEFKLYNTADAQIGAALTREDVQVTDGVFTVQLDFGQSPFTTGATNTLEIGVRPGASTGAFNALAPRQPVTSSPYAIQTINSAQLGGVPASQYVKTDDPRLIDGGPPAPGSNNYLQNTTTQQAGANFNIAGNGIVGGSVGIGTTPASDIRLQVDGNTKIITGAGAPGNRYQINFGSPNTETGMTLIKPATGAPTGRADLRFNGSTLKLVASTGDIPAETSGLAVSTAGDVGIGTVTPRAKLEILGSESRQGVLAFGGTGVSGQSNSGVGVHGTSNSGIGVFGSSTSGYAGAFNGRVTISETLQLNQIGINGGFGSLCINAQRIIAFCNSSSLRYKTDLLPFTGGLDIVNRLFPISYKWKADGTSDLGFGAEDVAKVEPLFTFHNNIGEVEGVRYERLSVVFVNAFKEQQAQIERQQKQIDELKKLVCRANLKVEDCKH